MEILESGYTEASSSDDRQDDIAKMKQHMQRPFYVKYYFGLFSPFEWLFVGKFSLYKK